MSKISLYVWGLGFGVLGLGFGVRVWGCGWWVDGLYVRTLNKNLLIKFLMMLFLVTKGCKFDSCGIRMAVSLLVTVDRFWFHFILQTRNLGHWQNILPGTPYVYIT